jgi:hypothetical protein
MGEFSPFGPLFYLGSFFLISERVRNFGLLFPHANGHVHIVFDKTRVGIQFGHFFTNSSGHPDAGSLPCKNQCRKTVCLCAYCNAYIRTPEENMYFLKALILCPGGAAQSASHLPEVPGSNPPMV